MSDQFKDNIPAKDDRSTQPTETPFHAERELRPSVGSDQRIESKLQALSPDKQVIDAKNLSSLEPHQLALLKETVNHAAELWEKVAPPLRNVYDNMMRNEMSGDEATKGEWSKNYFSKVESVLRENMKELSNEVPIRVAFAVQSFLPDAKGQMKGEVLYAFYPPLQADIRDKYIAFPLHSTDPSRESQLRKEGTLASSISSDEQVFRFKVNSLMERKQH